MVRKSIATYVVVTLILLQMSTLFTQMFNAQQQLFVLKNYSFKSSANTIYVYPGSRNAVLTVNVLYNGSSPAYVSAGCIELPPGFSITRGYSACSPPKTPNGSTYSVVEPGDIVVFEYHIDVDNSVSPGSYLVNIVLHYRIGGAPYSEVLSGIELVISSYPKAVVEVMDWYWSPDAYPGSQGVYLYITLRNTGNSSIVQANCVAQLQEVFTPNTIRFQLNNLGKNQTTSISIGPVSVSTRASPGTPYIVTLKLNATMATEDNVIYYTQTTTVFNVTVSQAPYVLIEVVDYGFETAKPVKNVVGARFYMVITNKDFKTIRSITAYFIIQSEGARFYNNSLTAVTLVEQAIGYGGTVTIYSPPMVLENTNWVTILVKLVIFGDNNGAEFWSTQAYVFNPYLRTPSINIDVLDVFWTSGEVYPGTEGVNLNIVLKNSDVVDVREAVATLRLPQGFYPTTLTVSGIAIQRGSITTLSFSSISVLVNVSPGDYPAQLIVKGIAYDPTANAFYEFTSTYIVSIKVWEKPSITIVDMVSSGWVQSKAYTTSVGLYAYGYFQVSSPSFRVEGVKATVYLSNAMIFENGNRSTVIVLGNNVYSYGQFIYVEFGPIDVTTFEEGLYPAVIRLDFLATSARGGSFWVTQFYTLLLPIHRATLNISLIDYRWGNPVTGSEASGASIYVLLHSLSIDTVQSMYVEVTLLNTVFLDGRNYTVQNVNNPIGFGTAFSLTIGGVEVRNVSFVTVRLRMYATLNSGRNSFYRASKEYVLNIATLTNLTTFRVVAIHTGFGNLYAPLLPSARGLTISIDIANTKTYQVAWVKPEVVAPQELKLNDVSGTCLNGVTSGGVCTITLNIDVDSKASTGVKNLTVILTYAVRDGQTLSVFREKLCIPIAIASYNYYRPEVDLINAFWGTQAPVRVLTGQRNAPLTITLINKGYYPVEGVYINVKPLNNTVSMIRGSDVCSPRLDPRTTCSATLYADLANFNVEGAAVFYVNVSYIFTYYGTNIVDFTTFRVVLYVDSAASGKGLELIDVSWVNNWPVYPNTENATLTISIANLWPYRVSGLDIELLLPQGFYTKYGSRARAYVSGPINSLQQFSVSIQLSVGDVKPGRYYATMVVSYVVETGSPNTRVVEEKNITITVNDLSKSINVVSTQWVGRSPQPPEYGAILMVVVRNNYNPSMRGVVLEVDLPEGFTSSDTNTSRVSVPASTVNIVQQLQGLQIPSVPGLQQIVSSLVQQASTQAVQGFGYGDLMYFYLKLNIATNRTGTYFAKAVLNFVDHWNNVRRIPLGISISLLGSAKIIDVVTPTTISISKGVAFLRIGIINTGSAPLYNVYVYLVPYAPMLIPQQAVKYIDFLPPMKMINVSYELVYNPLAVSAMGGAQAYLRYTSVPFSLSILYRDVYGNTQFFNTSIALLIQPFIDLVLLETKASASGNRLSISGTLANYGITSARSVVVKALYGGDYRETLVGDLDPASQAAFRIEMDIRNFVDRNLVLEVIYRDDYGRVNIDNYTISITMQTVEETTTVSQRESMAIVNHYVVIAAVTVFLAFTGYILYRYVKAHSKVIEKAVEGIETG